jgi:hypothetical protein
MILWVKQKDYARARGRWGLAEAKELLATEFRRLSAARFSRLKSISIAGTSAQSSVFSVARLTTLLPAPIWNRGTFGSTGCPSSTHFPHPPTSALALVHPRCFISRTTRVLVASFLHAQ